VTPRIRPARLDDLDDLLAIERVFPTDRLGPRIFRHAMRSPTTDLLVSEGANGAIGYVMIQRRRRSGIAHLSSIAVRRGAAGMGLGKRLLRAAEAEAGMKGCERLRLEVRADNRKAQTLYQKNGYHRVGIIEEYYEDGEAAWRYEKALTGRAAPASSPKPTTPRRR
jgi:ribosomal-protein-alanine N-acetyltransferase